MSKVMVMYKTAQLGAFFKEWAPRLWHSTKALVKGVAPTVRITTEKGIPVVSQEVLPVSRITALKSIARNPLAQLAAAGLVGGGGLYMLGKHMGRSEERSKPFYRRLFG